MSSSSDLSRRDLLRVLPIAATLVAASCRRAPYRASDFARPARSFVGLYDAPNYDADFADIIGRALHDLGLDARGKSVLLKPNLVEFSPGSAINTHPRVVGGAATAFLRAGAREVIVGEAPGHRRDIEYLLGSSGLGDELKSLGVPFVDLNHDDVRVAPLRSQFTTMTDLALPVTLLQADIIVSMPKLKTHHWAALTASMKNLFGVVPGAIYGWPKNILHLHGIQNSILDLVATIRPHLSIVDAVVAMEGDGPIMGSPRATGFVMMGVDPVAVDATCARLIGFDPARIGYIAQAAAFLGNMDVSRIDHRGEQPGRYQTRFEVLDQFKGLQLTSGG
ncbi:MAG: DUF362 domain-containing protein [Vicinamibacterales bacterium]